MDIQKDIDQLEPYDENDSLETPQIISIRFNLTTICGVAGVYFLKNRLGNIIYVGSSENIGKRVRGHAKKEWFEEVETVNYIPIEKLPQTKEEAFWIEYPEHRQASQAVHDCLLRNEQLYIEKEYPDYNIIGKIEPVYTLDDYQELTE